MSTPPAIDVDPTSAPALAFAQAAGLTDHQRRTIPGDVPVGMHLLKFNEAQFDASAFSQLRLALPANIAGSVRQRQAEFLFGRLAARLALAEHGRAGWQVAVAHTRAPVGPAGFIGSITHCRQHAAAVALPQAALRGIGIDIETLIPPQHRAGVERLVLRPSEHILLQQTSDVSHALLLTAAFSAKESFYKAVSAAAGGYFGFEVMRITAIDIAAGRIAFSLDQNVCPEWPRGRSGEIDLLRLEDDVVLTLFRW